MLDYVIHLVLYVPVLQTKFSIAGGSQGAGRRCPNLLKGTVKRSAQDVPWRTRAIPLVTTTVRAKVAVWCH